MAGAASRRTRGASDVADRKLTHELAENQITAETGLDWGGKWRNDDGTLPKVHSYREYDVDPPDPAVGRNTERLVYDETSGDWYYTSDHCKTFTKLDEDDPLNGQCPEVKPSDEDDDKESEGDAESDVTRGDFTHITEEIGAM